MNLPVQFSLRSVARFIKPFKSEFDEIGVKYNIMNVLGKCKVLESKDNITTVELDDGTICRYSNGRLHCEDDYAVVTPNGEKYSFVDGVLHSIIKEGVKVPSVITKFGVAYHSNGYLNNPVGPAISMNGVKIWMRNDTVYNTCIYPTGYDSPGAAIEHPEFKSWFNDGREIAIFLTPKPELRYSQEDVNALLAKQKQELIEEMSKLFILSD